MTSSKKPQEQEAPQSPNKQNQLSEADALFDDLSSFLEEGIKAIEKSSGITSPTAPEPTKPKRSAQTLDLGLPKLPNKPTSSRPTLTKKPLGTSTRSFETAPLVTPKEKQSLPSKKQPPVKAKAGLSEEAKAKLSALKSQPKPPTPPKKQEEAPKKLEKTAPKLPTPPKKQEEAPKKLEKTAPKPPIPPKKQEEAPKKQEAVVKSPEPPTPPKKQEEAPKPEETKVVSSTSSNQVESSSVSSSEQPSVFLLVAMFLLGAFAVWLYVQQKNIAQQSQMALQPVKQNVSILETSGKRQFETIQSLKFKLKALTLQVTQLQARVERERAEQLASNKRYQQLLASHSQKLAYLLKQEKRHTNQLTMIQSWKKQVKSKTLPLLLRATTGNHQHLAVHKAHTKKKFTQLERRENQRFSAQTQTNRLVAKTLKQLASTDAKTSQRITKEFTRTDKRFATYSKQTKTHLSVLDQTTQQHQKKLIKLANTLHPLPQQVATLIHGLKRANKAIKKTQLRSDARSWMFTRIVAEIKPVQKGIKQLNNHLKQAKRRIKQLEYITKNHRLVVANVSSTLPSAMQLLKTLSSQINAQQRKLNHLQKQLKHLTK